MNCEPRFVSLNGRHNGRHNFIREIRLPFIVNDDRESASLSVSVFGAPMKLKKAKR